jgi:hypothetical protein
MQLRRGFVLNHHVVNALHQTQAYAASLADIIYDTTWYKTDEGSSSFNHQHPLTAFFRACIYNPSLASLFIPTSNMQFSKIASVAILFVLSFLSLAMASPVARSTETDVEAIVTSLKATISPNIANISEL